mmetsp:Transcript_14663/g.39491  ORF Transcript_14663/g.39491 Transcript_14663/m.39491 type:complete len:305 (+) Transcript_14663:533-1447(+)
MGIRRRHWRSVSLRVVVRGGAVPAPPLLSQRRGTEFAPSRGIGLCDHAEFSLHVVQVALELGAACGRASRPRWFKRALPSSRRGGVGHRRCGRPPQGCRKPARMVVRVLLIRRAGRRCQVPPVLHGHALPGPVRAWRRTRTRPSLGGRGGGGLGGELDVRHLEEQVQRLLPRRFLEVHAGTCGRGQGCRRRRLLTRGRRRGQRRGAAGCLEGRGRPRAHLGSRVGPTATRSRRRCSHRPAQSVALRSGGGLARSASRGLGRARPATHAHRGRGRGVESAPHSEWLALTGLEQRRSYRRCRRAFP